MILLSMTRPSFTQGRINLQEKRMSLNSYRVYQNNTAFKKKFLQPFYQCKLLWSSKAPHLLSSCDFSSVQVLSCDLFHLPNQASPLLALQFSTNVTQGLPPHKGLELSFILLFTAFQTHLFIHCCSILPALCNWNCTSILADKLLAQCLLANSWYITQHFETMSPLSCAQQQNILLLLQTYIKMGQIITFFATLFWTLI